MFPLSDSIPARRFPYINFLLIVVTAYIFFLQVTSSNPDAFVLQYALTPANINLSDFSTLTPFVTAIFLHGGFLHIISNMWFLWVFGDNIEGYLGFLPYLFLYFVSGIVGNVVQYMLMPTSTIPMLGASGAVAGILGAYFILFPNSKIKTLIPIFGFFTIADVSSTFMLGYWFVLQIISGAASLPFSSQTGGVAFWAHVGGFVVGLVLANILKPILYAEKYERVG